ncbi:hypothetical protein Lgra_1145 [Legionella gratiana]|uniref:Protein of uncharacterized function (DUF2490) n=1 Tax=Legionella gratiana TaxID=45066 RepID=A0A378J0K6_9GAMM|nr:DUF2490 domain-containing protein [Legionella gratiana]KTD11687.1 hypothetical protein Lgra_1145 [Legionella gratiana]STX40848.1 Protein of uncharacterised function (DUF2490) [Legionella gratiana]
MDLKIKGILYSLFSFLICTTLFAETQNYGTVWLNGTFIGPFSKKHEKWKYYLQPRLVIIDNRYGLDEARVFYGAGYQITPAFTSFIGMASSVSKSTEGVLSYENRVWQQFLWDIYKSKTFKLNNRTRLEERKNTLYSQWAVRFREQFTLKIPFQNTKYSFITFDELFFNVNYPSWVSDKFFSQNRYFIGIEKSISKSASFDVGYINQARFQRQNINIITDGLYLKIDVTS